jgi:hypothetical protein
MTSVLIARAELPQALDGAPSVIVLGGVALDDAPLPEGLVVWHAAAVPGGLLLHRGAPPPAGTWVPLTLAPPGLVAVLAPDVDAARGLLDWIAEVSSIHPPLVEAASAGQALLPLAGLLLRALDSTRAQLGELHRSLALTRTDYEDTRIAMGTVLRTLGGRPPAALRPALSALPEGGLAVRPAGQRLRLRQLPGLAVREIAALCLHFSAAACGPDMLLRVRLVAAESGRVVGSWMVPGPALEPGWLTLDLPAPAPALRESAMIEVSATLGEQDLLALSLENMVTGAATALEVLDGEADAGSRALALRLWTAEAGGRFVLPLHWCWDEAGASLPEAGLPYRLPAGDWSRAAVIEGRARAVALGDEVPRPVLVLERNTRTLVGLPVVQVAGMDVIRVDLGRLAGAAERVRAAVWLRDAARLEHLADPLPEHPGTPWSGWRDFDASSGQCAITLSLPVLARGAVQVVVGVQAPHPQAGAHAAVEVMALSALRTGQARPVAERDAALPAVALRPAPRFRSARMGGPHGQGAARHLEFMMLGLSARGQAWPALRFRLGLGDAAGAWIEIRQGKGWPEVFEAWPGMEADAQGPLLRLGAAELFGAASGDGRDNLMLAALAELMPALVEAAAGRSQEAQSEWATWQAAARQVAAAGQPPPAFRAGHHAAEAAAAPAE